MLRRLGLPFPEDVVDRIWASARKELSFKDCSISKDEVHSMCCVASFEAYKPDTSDEDFIKCFHNLFQRELRKYLSRRWVKTAGPKMSYHQSLVLEAEYNALYDAMGELRAHDKQLADLIRLRYWHTQPFKELATYISSSVRTVHRKMADAYTFLHRRIKARAEESVNLFHRCFS